VLSVSASETLGIDTLFQELFAELAPGLEGHFGSISRYMHGIIQDELSLGAARVGCHTALVYYHSFESVIQRCWTQQTI
jgi:hypothetical protein